MQWDEKYIGPLLLRLTPHFLVTLTMGMNFKTPNVAKNAYNFFFCHPFLERRRRTKRRERPEVKKHISTLFMGAP